MKKNLFLLFFFSALVLSFNSTSAQSYPDDIFGIKAGNKTYITKMRFNPNTGAYAGNYNNIEEIRYSVALAIAPNDYFYYIDGDFGEGDGKFDLWAVKKDGSSEFKVLNNHDVNGYSNDELGFVRLGSTKDGLLVIIAKNEYDNKIYATSVQTNPNGTVGTVTDYGQLSVSDNGNTSFKNGDLAITYYGDIFVLANNDNTDVTSIYRMNVSDLSGSKTLTKAWTVVDHNNKKFTKRVNGVAWSSTGSLFISDDENVYFIDQNTVNTSGTGTVKAKKVADCPEGLTDLASQYWVKETLLPVVWGNISAKTVGDNVVVNFTTESETNNHHFELLASNDGANFTKIAELKSKATNGNSEVPLSYEVTIPLSGKIALGFSILAMLSFGFIPNKKARILSSTLAVIAMFTMYSCSKNASEIQTDGNASYKFVKVVQVDIDGTSKESKVITIIKN